MFHTPYPLVPFVLESKELGAVKDTEDTFLMQSRIGWVIVVLLAFSA